MPAPTVARHLTYRIIVLALTVSSAGCGGAHPSPRAKELPPTGPDVPGLGASPGAAAPESAPSPEPTLSGIGDPPPPAASSDVPPSVERDLTPVPDVKLTNIGLHVGGGPNDAATKAPFERAIERRFDDFKRCYGKIATGGAHGTFGIDLLIGKDGGHAKASGSRTAMPGDEFRDCVANVFETVEFSRPRAGATKISYALKFEPGP
jgi:hypothetical protein